MYKKIVLPVALCLAVFAVNAQFMKGDKVLGAGLSFSTSKTEGNSNPNSVYTSTSNSGGISLELGLAGRANRLSGFYINASAGNSKSTYENLPSFNTSSDFYSLAPGLFTRRYQSLGKGFYLFAEGRAGAMYSRNNTANSPYIKRTSLGISAGLYPGLSYKAGNRFMLDLRFADFISLSVDRHVNSTAAGLKDISTAAGFSSSLGIGYLQQIGIGARWIIPEGKK